MSASILVRRRIVQGLVLALPVAAAAWPGQVSPWFSGDLAASRLAGTVHLADPLLVLQTLLAGWIPAWPAVAGAATIFVAWTATGGRSFCSWACPVNAVSETVRSWSADIAGSLPRRTRYLVLLAVLALPPLAGLPAFDYLNPVTMISREAAFGAWQVALLFAAAVAVLDLLYRDAFCGHVCPVGAFWALAGRLSLVRVAHAAARCTDCGACSRACPEAQVLEPVLSRRRTLVPAGECTVCGRCVASCPTAALRFTVAAPGARGMPSPTTVPSGSQP